MIPFNSLGEYQSTLLVSDHYLTPDDRDTLSLLVYEQGGTALNYPDDGLNVIPWTLRYLPATDEIVIESETTPPTVLFTAPNVTQIDLTFDQNMNPFVAFVEDGQAKFWWYDSEIPGTTISNLPAGALTPRCCLDDKLQELTGESDICLCYVESGALKFRLQRERYTTAHIIDDPFLHPTLGLPAVLKKVGMHKSRRLQWLCDLANPLDWCGYKAEVA